MQYVLQYLQSHLDEGLAASISACHMGWMDRPVECHPLVSRFMKGFRCLCPASTRSMASWDLDMVLAALAKSPFEQLESASLKHLSMKVAFLKRLGELHALSVSSKCYRMDPGERSISLHPNPSFLPKVLSDRHVNILLFCLTQVYTRVNL